MWGYSRAASHPSDTDRESMHADNVYVIVSVNDRLREVPWKYNDDGSLSGTTDDHHFRLTAYAVQADESSKTRSHPVPVRSGLRCAAAARRALAATPITRRNGDTVCPLLLHAS